MRKRLLEEAFRFDFIRAVRWIYRMYPEKSAIGHDAHPTREAVRLRPVLSFTFPPSEVHRAVDRSKDGGPPLALDIRFLGLYGATGVLPWHYTQTLLDEAKAGRHAFRDFLDMFNHRLLSLFFRASTKYRFPYEYEPGGTDAQSRRLSALLGLGTRGFTDRLEFPWTRLLAYAGLFVGRRSAAGLAAMLGDSLEERVRIEQFHGEWVPIPPEDRTRLGRAGRSELGSTTTLGRRIWSRQHKFRVRIGPLTLERYRELLPDGDRFRELVQLVRLWVGDSIDFDVELLLEARDVPGTRLGSGGSRVGWTSWLGTGNLTDGVFGAVFSREGVAETRERTPPDGSS